MFCLGIKHFSNCYWFLLPILLWISYTNHDIKLWLKVDFLITSHDTYICKIVTKYYAYLITLTCIGVTKANWIQSHISNQLILSTLYLMSKLSILNWKKDWVRWQHFLEANASLVLGMSVRQSSSVFCLLLSSSVFCPTFHQFSVLSSTVLQFMMMMKVDEGWWRLMEVDEGWWRLLKVDEGS